jgi:hypothetical protein
VTLVRAVQFDLGQRGFLLDHCQCCTNTSAVVRAMFLRRKSISQETLSVRIPRCVFFPVVVLFQVSHSTSRVNRKLQSNVTILQQVFPSRSGLQHCKWNSEAAVGAVTKECSIIPVTIAHCMLRSAAVAEVGQGFRGPFRRLLLLRRVASVS